MLPRLDMEIGNKLKLHFVTHSLYVPSTCMLRLGGIEDRI